jgi:hypothetical protein
MHEYMYTWMQDKACLFVLLGLHVHSMDQLDHFTLLHYSMNMQHTPESQTAAAAAGSTCHTLKRVHVGCQCVCVGMGWGGVRESTRCSRLVPGGALMQR